MGATNLNGCQPGVYLTDGRGLYRVVRATGTEMLLEDCKAPDSAPVALTAAQLRADKWRSVKPAKEAT